MRTATGRQRHDAKITVYLSREELLRLEGTVLELERLYGIRIDRSRYVREALAASSMRSIAARLRGRAS